MASACIAAAASGASSFFAFRIDLSQHLNRTGHLSDVIVIRGRAFLLADVKLGIPSIVPLLSTYQVGVRD